MASTFFLKLPFTYPFRLPRWGGFDDYDEVSYFSGVYKKCWNFEREGRNFLDQQRG